MHTLRMLTWAATVTVALMVGKAGLADENRPGPAAPTAPTASNATVVRLSRLHHIAKREVQLGRLAEVGANQPETRAYGAGLAADFQTLDDRFLAAAKQLGVDPARLEPVYAGENTASLRREAEDLTRLGAARGDAFDQLFWVIVSQDQMAAADALLPVAGTDPRLEPVVADLAQQLETSSRLAVAAAEPVAPPPPSRRVQPPPVPSSEMPAPPVTPPLPSGVELPPVPGRDIIPPPAP